MRKILIAFLLAATVLYAGEKRNYEIWGKDSGEIIIMPHVAPLIGVKQVSGPKMPEHGSVNCEFKREMIKSPNGDKIPILVGNCEGGIKVHVTSIDLNH